MSAGLIESTERYPGAPQQRFVPRVFRELHNLSANAAFFVGSAHRARSIYMLRARSTPGSRANLVRSAREENHEMIRWLRSARP